MTGLMPHAPIEPPRYLSIHHAWEDYERGVKPVVEYVEREQAYEAFCEKKRATPARLSLARLQLGQDMEPHEVAMGIRAAIGTTVYAVRGVVEFFARCHGAKFVKIINAGRATS